MRGLFAARMKNTPSHLYNRAHATEPLTNHLPLLLLSHPVQSLKIVDRTVLVLRYLGIYWLCITAEEITAGFFPSEDDAVEYAHSVLACTPQ